MGGGVKCKLWWPRELTFSAPDRGLLLFGWCFGSGSGSVDLVVATGVSDDAVFRSDVKEALCHINEKMSVSLRDYSLISLLGHCAVPFESNNSEAYQQKSMFLGDSNGRPCFLETREDVMSKSTSCSIFVNEKHDQVLSSEPRLFDDYTMCSCGSLKLDNYFEHLRKSLIRNGSWIQLISESQEFSSKWVGWKPELHHLHQNGQQISVHHLHVIIYEPPTRGNHHLSLNTWNSWMQARTSLRVPNWLDALQKKNPPLDLETVISALNSSNTVKEGIEGCLVTKSSLNQIPTRSILTAIFWHIVAVSVASISTSIYIIVQVCHRFLVCGPLSYLFIMFAKLFHHACMNIHIRCSQLQYWSTFLQGSGSSFQPNVEHAHEAALRRHALWSNIVIDVLLGNIVGLLMLGHVRSICLWVSNVASDITNNLLRSGCVWLMGVPAGFKLNTELAELLGMISLNAIQIWSTLWFFVGLAFDYVVIVLAFSGIFLGSTIPAALCIDVLKLGTMHISSLHMLISFLYSQQIQALASLWRLFRGQKWNPLRQRLDSFDYTVEEHVVGSLLFTLVLLLLPTTTVFYIFFTIMNLVANFSCIIVEIMISILYATPHAEIFLWILRRGRFPSGVWFEVITSQNKNSSSNLGFVDKCSPPSDMSSLHSSQSDISKPSTSIYVLHSNFANIGQILRPLFKKVFDRFSLASSKACVYGVLSGQRTNGTFRTHLPPTMPWINLSFMEYWRLCHSSVIGCSS